MLGRGGAGSCEFRWFPSQERMAGIRRVHRAANWVRWAARGVVSIRDGSPRCRHSGNVRAVVRRWRAKRREPLHRWRCCDEERAWPIEHRRERGRGDRAPSSRRRSRCGARKTVELRSWSRERGRRLARSGRRGVDRTSPTRATPTTRVVRVDGFRVRVGLDN